MSKQLIRGVIKPLAGIAIVVFFRAGMTTSAGLLFLSSLEAAQSSLATPADSVTFLLRFVDIP
jgi:hypothetical protein